MGSVMTYSGITTKIRAMQAKLLKPEDFEQIASLKSVAEVTEYLKGESRPMPRTWRIWTVCSTTGEMIEKVLYQSLFVILADIPGWRNGTEAVFKDILETL